MESLDHPQSLVVKGAGSHMADCSLNFCPGIVRACPSSWLDEEWRRRGYGVAMPVGGAFFLSFSLACALLQLKHKHTNKKMEC